MVPLEDPIVTEVTSTLQDWALLWKQLYVVSTNMSPFHHEVFVVQEHQAACRGRQPALMTAMLLISSHTVASGCETLRDAQF